jgi:hypothetical protein
MATASLGGYGVGNVAVVQALYAVYLNRHTPYSDAGYLLLVAAGDPLYEDMELAMYSDYYMEKVVHRIAHATGIENDNLSGSIDQLAAGLQVGSNFFLPCSSGNFLAGRSSQIYTSTGFMGNIDVSGFTNLLLDGTVMIVQTNKLVWNSSRHAWNYGDDGIYLVKSVNRFITISGTTYNYALYDVATGATKVVSPQNGAIRNIWSTGSISGLHTVAILDDGDPDYTEVITGFAGLDPLVNYF